MMSPFAPPTTTAAHSHSWTICGCMEDLVAVATDGMRGIQDHGVPHRRGWKTPAPSVLGAAIEVRAQKPARILTGVLLPGAVFTCNLVILGSA